MRKAGNVVGGFEDFGKVDWLGGVNTISPA